MVLADSHRISRVLWYLGRHREPTRFRLRGCHPLWPAFPGRSANVLVSDSPALNRTDPTPPPPAGVLGFRLFPFPPPFPGKSIFLSLPGGTEMSPSPPLPLPRLCIQRAVTGHDSRRVPP